MSIAICASLSIIAQKRHPKFDAYINKYYKIAIKEQQKYGIPASITLAQGLLESGAGESRLATQGKNHFGIKCGSEWYGKKIYADDDAIGECFRSYNNPAESFKDHSLFLKRQRYAFLFDYTITDYKAWAHGLRRAGYATDPKYPTKLITIIETYELYKFDKMSNVDEHKSQRVNSNEYKPEETEELFGYIEIFNNGVKCIHLTGNDNIQNIAEHFNISKRLLLFFNDMYEPIPLQRGDYVYLFPKKSQASKGIKSHKVAYGESMHSISQDYGVRMKKLYKINNLEYGTPLKVGQIIKLRK